MKFTSEKPTVPGTYWYRDKKELRFLTNVFFLGEELWAAMRGKVGWLRKFDGEWSERLVPVGEIRKAFDEGFADAHGIWEDSRACRVVEGKEEV